MVRRADNFLIEAAFAPSTVRRYTAAVRAFLEWIFDNNYQLSSTSEVDELLLEYLHDFYLAGGSKGAANNVVYGIIMLLPGVRHRIPSSRLALRGWSRLHPPQSYPPLTWELAVVIGVQMTRSGHFAEGLATVLGFHCYLRLGEICNLRVSDVADSGDARVGCEYRGMALRLRTTKTGPNQWVEVKDAAVIALLRQRLSGRRSGTFAFGFSASSYRRLFKAVLSNLGLRSSYVPHSLRHGGATRDHLLGASLEHVLMRGRWASTKSARHYIQAGRAMLLANDVPRPVADLGTLFASDLVSSFSLAQRHFVGAG